MTSTAYKITRLNRTTHGMFRWPEPGGELVETSGEGDLCTPGWLHWYTSPLLAVLLNPIYGCYAEPYLLWEAEVGGRRLDDHGLKFGTTHGRLMRQIEASVVTTRERVCCAIKWARAVSRNPIPAWDRWAENYIAGDAEADAQAAWAAGVTAEAKAASSAVAAVAAGGVETPLDLHGIADRAIRAERERVKKQQEGK